MGINFSLEAPQLAGALVEYRSAGALPTYSTGIILAPANSQSLGFLATITQDVSLLATLGLSLPLKGPGASTYVPCSFTTEATRSLSGSQYYTGSVLCPIAESLLGTGPATLEVTYPPFAPTNTYAFYLGQPAIPGPSPTAPTVTLPVSTVAATTITATSYMSSLTQTMTTTLTGAMSTKYVNCFPPTTSKVASTMATSTSRKTTTTAASATAKPSTTAGACVNDTVLANLERTLFANPACKAILSILPTQLPPNAAHGIVGQLSSACSCFEKSRPTARPSRRDTSLQDSRTNVRRASESTVCTRYSIPKAGVLCGVLGRYSPTNELAQFSGITDTAQCASTCSQNSLCVSFAFDSENCVLFSQSAIDIELSPSFVTNIGTLYDLGCFSCSVAPASLASSSSVSSTAASTGTANPTSTGPITTSSTAISTFTDDDDDCDDETTTSTPTSTSILALNSTAALTNTSAPASTTAVTSTSTLNITNASISTSTLSSTVVSTIVLAMNYTTATMSAPTSVSTDDDDCDDEITTSAPTSTSPTALFPADNTTTFAASSRVSIVTSTSASTPHLVGNSTASSPTNTSPKATSPTTDPSSAGNSTTTAPRNGGSITVTAATSSSTITIASSASTSSYPSSSYPTSSTFPSSVTGFDAPTSFLSASTRTAAAVATVLVTPARVTAGTATVTVTAGTLSRTAATVVTIDHRSVTTLAGCAPSTVP